MNSERTINVAETFTSIQGESRFSGFPCFFIRLAGCNLNCSFCDTDYARESGSGTDMSIASLIRNPQK